MTGWDEAWLAGYQARRAEPLHTVDALVALAEPITLMLPLPPSVNGMWANVPGKGRVRTEEYSEWRRVALLEAAPQLAGKRRIYGWFKATIHVAMRRGGDLDNRIKPCLDICKSVGAIKDDKGLIALKVYLCRGPAGVRIHLAPASGDEIPRIGAA